ncbi:MAG: hypothetical protein ACREJ5_20195 [Geminicoccaceae bacterium]
MVAAPHTATVSGGDRLPDVSGYLGVLAWRGAHPELLDGVADRMPSGPNAGPNATTANSVTAGGSDPAWRCTGGATRLLSTCLIAA